MKIRFLTFLLTSLLLFSTAGFSGVADLAITLEHQPLDDLQFGQVIPFSITITNNGPDTAGEDTTTIKPIEAYLIINKNTPLFVEQNSSIGQPCDFLLAVGEPIPPNTVDFIYSFYFPPIPANDSLTCYGLFQVVFQTGNRTIEWSLIPALNDSDPDETNNTATMVFGIKPPMVPSLTTYSMLFLMLLIFVLTKRQFMRKASNTSHKKH